MGDEESCQLDMQVEIVNASPKQFVHANFNLPRRKPGSFC